MKEGHGNASNTADRKIAVTFQKVGKTTKLSMKTLFETAENRNHVAEKYNAVEGLSQNMDKLAAYL